MPMTLKKSLLTVATPARVGSAVPATEVTPPPYFAIADERVAAIAKVVEIRVRQTRIGAAVVHFPDRHQPIGRRVRQRPQQHTVDDGEDRGRGADGQCQGEDCHDRGAKVLEEHAAGVAEVEHGCHGG